MLARPERAMVVRCRRSAYDVYVGRGACPETGLPGEWGNPFVMGVHGTREQVIRKFEEWLLQQPAMMAKLPSLKGKVLGCWCSPQACHGEVLVRLSNAEE
jgi:Domain of unknown function (DUF4326)